jgi:hypothetical protein
MSIMDHIVVGLDEQVLNMYWCMWYLWGLVNLVAFVTVWSNCNHYFKLVLGGRMR